MAPPRHQACTKQLTSKVFFVYYQSVINFSASEIMLQAPNGPKVTCLVPNSHRMHIAAPNTHRNTLLNVTSVAPKYMTESHRISPRFFRRTRLSRRGLVLTFTLLNKLFSVLNFIYLASNTNNKAKQFKENFLRSFRACPRRQAKVFSVPF